MNPVYLVVEGQDDAEFLSTLLSDEMLQNIKFVLAMGRYGAQTLAASLIANRQLPVVLLIDSDTLDEERITQEMAFSHNMIRVGAGDVSFKVLFAVPEIEIILLQDKALFEKLIQRPLSAYEWENARKEPRKTIETFTGQTAPEVVSRLSNDERELLKKHPLIQELLQFISVVLTEAPHL